MKAPFRPSPRTENQSVIYGMSIVSVQIWRPKAPSFSVALDLVKACLLKQRLWKSVIRPAFWGQGIVTPQYIL